MNDLLMPRPKGPIRFSHLKAYGKSALHGYHARTAADDEQNQAMERGTAVHAILFETKRVVGYAGVRNEKHKAYQEFAAEHQGCEILTMADFDKARRMADAVRAHPLAWPLLQGVREETLLFRWNGLDCRSTPDVRGEEFITELKSGATCAPGRFEWHAVKKMSYHAQMRMESLAMERRIGHAPLDHYIVAVEQAAPFPVQVYRLDERALEAGEKSLILWSERLKVAEDSGQYPAYSQTILPIDLPEEEEVEEDLDLVFGALPAMRGADPAQEKYGLQI